MSAHEKKSLEVAANASLAKSLSYRIYENGKALQELTTKHGVILEDTPSDYFTEYMAAAKACLLYTSPSPRDRQKSRMPSSA